MVDIPAGTFLVGSTLNLPSGIFLHGASHVATVIKLANSANADVIRTSNFASLTGRMPVFERGRTARFWSLDLQIDGNKANNTASRGVAIFGKRYIINHVLIRDTHETGLYSECGDKGGQNDWTDLPTCWIGPVWIKQPRVSDCTTADRTTAQSNGWTAQGQQMALLSVPALMAYLLRMRRPPTRVATSASFTPTATGVTRSGSTPLLSSLTT